MQSEIFLFIIIGYNQIGWQRDKINKEGIKVVVRKDPPNYNLIAVHLRYIYIYLHKFHEQTALPYVNIEKTIEVSYNQPKYYLLQ